jgi:pyruvate,water dikinase
MDAPTDEFRQMEGGEDEPIEPNPMLGWRGIRRDLREVDVFKMQLQTFKNLIDDGYTNIGIMLPLVQHQDEVQAAKEKIAEIGIDFEQVDVGIMIEIPASALIIEDLIAEGRMISPNIPSQSIVTTKTSPPCTTSSIPQY